MTITQTSFQAHITIVLNKYTASVSLYEIRDYYYILRVAISLD